MAAGDESRKSAFVLARIRRVQRRLNLEGALSSAVVPAWVAVTLLAVWRFVVQWRVGIFAGVVFVAAVVVWRVLSRKKGVTLGQAAVIADRRAEAGGLLLTRLETGVGEWELGLNDRVRALTPPPIQVRRSVGALALAALFVIVAMLVPLPPKVINNVNAAAATKLDEVTEKLEAIAKEEPLDDAVTAELERLQEELADNAFDAADWEAADALDKELDRKAQEAGAELSRAEDAAKELADAMASAQGAEAATREKEELESALMQLSDGQAADADQAMDQALGKEPDPLGTREKQSGEKQDGEKQDGEKQDGEKQDGEKSGGEKSGAGSGQLSELRQALKDRQQQLQKSFSKGQGGPQKSARAGSGKGEGGEDGKGKGEGKPGKKSADTREHASRSTKAGTGRGDSEETELIYGGQAEIDPDRLAFQALPQGNGGDEPGELWGLKAANPKKNSTGHAASSSSGASATGDQAPGNREGQLLPRNRALIQKYFDNAPRNP